MIFEDSEKSKISDLLLRTDEPIVNSVDSFAKGNDNLKKYIRRALREYNEVLCFVDVVPDNEYTVGLYNNLVRYSLGRELIIIPIPCIEYVVLKSVSILPQFADNQIIKSVLSFSKYSESSFEVRCKAIINRDDTVRCLSKYAGDNSYYLMNCLCDSVLDHCSELSLDRKCALLYETLPCSFGGSENLIPTCVSSVFDNVRQQYKTMWESISGFKRLTSKFEDLLWCDTLRSKYV